MIASLRGQLAAAIALLLAIVLALSAMLLWSTQRASTYSERAHYAHEQLVAYLQLAHEADAFLHDARSLPGSGNVAARELAQLRTRLVELTERIGGLVERESALGDAIHEPAEARERERAASAHLVVGRFTDALGQSLKAHADVGPDGPGATSSTVLAAADDELQGLVEAAVHEERAEVRDIQRRAAELTARAFAVAITAAAAALLLAPLTGWIAFRGVTGPVQALVEGASRFAAGDLDGRIDVHRPTELAHVASAFNEMAAELERRTERLEEARRTLERRVKARTEALDRTNRKLRSADRSRRQFFADVSHELRTPLTLIRGEAELALQPGDAGATRHTAALTRISDLSRQMGRLVDDMLFLARSSSAKAPVHLAPVELRALVEDTQAQMQGACAHLHRRLSLRVGTHDYWIRADEQRLKQVLRILLDNAMQYSRTGDDIVLGLERQSGCLLLTVTDTGPGIDPEALEQVFRRFYRGEEARRLNPAGSGLGLAVARSIVRAHRGEIAVESAPGKGTCVSVRLLEEAHMRRVA